MTNNMLGLTPVQFDDYHLLTKYYSRLDRPLADLNAAMMIAWRHCLDLQIGMDGDVLFVVGSLSGVPYLWGPPIGPGLTFRHLDIGENLIRNLRGGSHGTEPFCLYVWDGYPLWSSIADNSRYECVHQAQEYLYCTKMLSSLQGGDLKSKRKDRNRFVRQFQPDVRALSPDLVPGCIDLLKHWRDWKQNRVDKTFRKKFDMEAEVCFSALNEGIPLEGVVALVDDNIVAFSLGTSHGQRAFNCMFEKARPNLPGAYSFIFSELGRYCCGRYDTINAGEDWGVTYLYESKNHWQPKNVQSSFSLKVRDV